VADEPVKKTKRRVKNPETFRERAIKASASDGKPSKIGRAKQASGKAVTPVTRPVGNAAAVFARQKPFQLLRKPLRLIGRLIVPMYFRNSWKELRLVTWPSWRVSVRLTFAVIVFAVIFAAFVALLDFGLDKLFKNILLS
jgi:preprotein translocase SecE subunit